MAIYHLSVKPISRGAGRSATAAAAYRSATRIRDQQTGEVFDYSRKRGVEHTEIIIPRQASESGPTWAGDREALWNAAEAIERRKDARVAREYEVALPHELTPEQRQELVMGFARDLAERYGVAVDVAIHRPHRQGDDRNHHAHILTTTRSVCAGGLGAKTPVELGDRDRAKLGLGRGADEITEIRERWAGLTNAALMAARQSGRVDHRTLSEQGIDRVPSSHLGPVVTERLRRGKDSFVAERILEERLAEANTRLAAAAERGQLERQGRELDRAIIDTESTLKAALAVRDALNKKSTDPEARRVDALQRWLEFRQAPTLPDVSAGSTLERRHALDGGAGR